MPRSDGPSASSSLERLTRSGWSVAAVVFLLALGLRLGNVAALAGTPLYQMPHGDGRGYLEWADAIRAGGLGGLFERGEPFYQAPLYPYLLAALRSVLGESLTVLRSVQAAAGALGAVCIALATRRALAGALGSERASRCGLAAGLLVAALPAAIWLDGLVQKSALVTLLLSAAMLCFTFAGPRASTGLGVLAGLLMLTRGEARLLALVFGVFVLQRARRDAAFYALGLAVVLVPTLLRNGVLGGEWVLTTAQSGPNLFIGNQSGSNGTYAPLVPGRGDVQYEAEDAKTLASEALGRDVFAAEASAYWRRRAFDEITSNPGAAARRFGRKAVMAIGWSEVADTDDFGHARGASIVLRVPLGFGVVLALALVGVVAATVSERRAVLPFLGLAAAQFAALVVFYVFARYRLPMTLALIPPAALGALHLARLRDRPWLAAVLAAGVAVSFASPYDAEGGRAAALVTEGNLLVEAERYEAARERAEEAVALSPKLFDAQRLLALVYMKGADSDGARAALERAHALAPDDWQVRSWLGIAFGETGEYERAQVLLVGAAMDRPEALPIVSNAVGLSLALAAKDDAIRVLRARYGSREGDERTGADDVPLRLQYAWLLATDLDPELRDGNEAARIVAPAVAASPQQPAPLEVQAAAFAETGRFVEARSALERCIAAGGGSTPRIDAAMACYRADRPYHVSDR